MGRFLSSKARIQRNGQFHTRGDRRKRRAIPSQIQRQRRRVTAEVKPRAGRRRAYRWADRRAWEWALGLTLADAWRYLAMAWREPVPPDEKKN